MSTGENYAEKMRRKVEENRALVEAFRDASRGNLAKNPLYLAAKSGRTQALLDLLLRHDSLKAFLADAPINAADPVVDMLMDISDALDRDRAKRGTTRAP